MMRLTALSAMLMAGVTLGSSGVANAYPVAGLAPYQRPTGAPVIAHVSHGPPWYAAALTGVIPPYPTSLRFLEDQGNWYTPFNRPGMLPPYDLRGWHR